MSLRLIHSDSPNDVPSPSLRPSGTSYSVWREWEHTRIDQYCGGGGDFEDFEEAKEDAIFWLEDMIETLQERIEEIRSAKTYEDYESDGI